ncbi:unnamed protein product [Macrosiphum euphorbiae]|uniref:Uncharacterized protein n=1 Tax=Macrosiphum euphorbiae TaxID=13131 RepID=A0AAV0XML3_9HEMI|nr:unnamed protein product [Macrosiphum euphorbiae]
MYESTIKSTLFPVHRGFGRSTVTGAVELISYTLDQFGFRSQVDVTFIDIAKAFALPLSNNHEVLVQYSRPTWNRRTVTIMVILNRWMSVCVSFWSQFRENSGFFGCSPRTSSIAVIIYSIL